MEAIMREETAAERDVGTDALASMVRNPSVTDLVPHDLFAPADDPAPLGPPPTYNFLIHPDLPSVRDAPATSIGDAATSDAGGALNHPGNAQTTAKEREPTSLALNGLLNPLPTVLHNPATISFAYPATAAPAASSTLMEPTVDHMQEKSPELGSPPPFSDVTPTNSDPTQPTTVPVPVPTPTPAPASVSAPIRTPPPAMAAPPSFVPPLSPKDGATPAPSFLQPSEPKPATTLAPIDLQPSEQKPGTTPPPRGLQPSEAKPATDSEFPPESFTTPAPTSKPEVAHPPAPKKEQKPGTTPPPRGLQPFEAKPATDSEFPPESFTTPAPTSKPEVAHPPAPKKDAKADIVLLDDSGEEDVKPPKNLTSGLAPPKRPRSPDVIDVDDDDQIRSLSVLPPARRRTRHVRSRHVTQGLPLPGAAPFTGFEEASRIHVSRGGGLFSVDPEGTVNIVDSEEEAELQNEDRLVNTAQGMTALPPGAQFEKPMKPSSLARFGVVREQEDGVAAPLPMPQPDAWDFDACVPINGIPGSAADPSSSLPGPHPWQFFPNPGFPVQPMANGTSAHGQVNDWDQPLVDTKMNLQMHQHADDFVGRPLYPVNGVKLETNPNVNELKVEKKPIMSAYSAPFPQAWNPAPFISDAFTQENVPVGQALVDMTRKISFGSSQVQNGQMRPEFVAISSPGAIRPHPMENPPMFDVSNTPIIPPADAGPSHIDNPAERDGLSERGLRTLMKQNEITADATEEAETPAGLNVTLMPHQKRALAWMTKREKPIHSDEDLIAVDDECLGGILADDQGLGKTLTMIALLLKAAPSSRKRDSDDEGDEHLSSDKSTLSDTEDDFIDDSSPGEPKCSPWRTLIVCPPSVINQWKEELISRIKETHMPKIYIYHGARRERSVTKLKKYDVVLTTYATLVNEYPKILKNHPEFKMRKAGKLKLPQRSSGPLCRMSWIRVVLDESQYVKNRSTESWNAVMALKAEKRWCLSGTPIQNCVDDLYALFCFIRYHFVRNYEMWNKTWKKKLESPYEQVRKRAFRQFQTITGVVLLRRTKVDEINGKPLIVLPPRTTEVMLLEFDQGDENAFYRAVAAKTVIRFNKFLAEGSITTNYSNILLLLLRLRQASSHPFLIQYAQMQGRREMSRELDPRYATAYTVEEMEEAMELASGGDSLMELIDEGVRETVAKYLEPPEKGNGIATSFTCCFCGRGSLWAHGTALPCGELLCKQCCEHVQNQGKCLRCRYSIAGRDTTETLINVDHLRREVHGQVILGTRIGTNVTGAEFKVLLQEEIERRRLGKSIVESRDESTGDDSSDDVAIGELRRRSLKEGSASRQTQQSMERDGRSRTHRRTEQSKKKLLDALSLHSTKIRVIVEELNKIRDRGEGEKTLVFSQWTSMLDIIEFHARMNGHDVCRLDGTMTLTARQLQIQKFRDSATKNVFLISLHAGGTGLNLTAASRVILCDVWWNPAVEEQAIDRAHRIGQTKPVHVIRFRMNQTVEDDIYKLCERKRSMANGTLGEKGKQNLGRTKLSQRELMSLFSGAAANVARNAGENSAAAQAARNILNFHV